MSKVSENLCPARRFFDFMGARDRSYRDPRKQSSRRKRPKVTELPVFMGEQTDADTVRGFS